jgi:hypothetical protein
VLIDDPCVLNGHQPVAKFDHLRPMAEVLLVEGRGFKGRDSSHGGQR